MSTKKVFVYNGEELTFRQLKQKFKNVSFPPEECVTQESFPSTMPVTVKEVEIEVHVPTLEELKQRKLNALEASFDRAVSGSFECSLGYPMQFNRSDALAVQGAIMLLEANNLTTGYLTDANDVTHKDVSKDDMTKVMYEMLAKYASCHSKKQDYRELINNCTTEEELNNITFNWE